MTTLLRIFLSMMGLIYQETTKDIEKNNYGDELLELCKNYNVHLLNGRLDGNSKGEITCIANDGANTVDYGIVNTRLFDKINSFEIIQRVESDHFPICCTLRISHGLPLDPTNSNVHLQPLTRLKYSSRGTKHFLKIYKNKKQIQN